MHQLDCSTVQAWLERGRAATIPDAVQAINRTRLPPGMQIVACCSEDVAGTQRNIITSLSQLKVCPNAVHGIALRYYSSIERHVGIVGGTVNGQILFVDDAGSEDKTFEKECSSSKLKRGDHNFTGCAEVSVGVSQAYEGKQVDEYINGEIFVYGTSENHVLAERYTEKYQIKLAAR